MVAAAPVMASRTGGFAEGWKSPFMTWLFGIDSMKALFLYVGDILVSTIVNHHQTTIWMNIFYILQASQAKFFVLGNKMQPNIYFTNRYQKISKNDMVFEHVIRGFKFLASCWVSTLNFGEMYRATDVLHCYKLSYVFHQLISLNRKTCCLPPKISKKTETSQDVTVQMELSSTKRYDTKNDFFVGSPYAPL